MFVILGFDLLLKIELSYDFCRRMELLPADSRRIVALEELPFASSMLHSLSSFATFMA